MPRTPSLTRVVAFHADDGPIIAASVPTRLQHMPWALVDLLVDVLAACEMQAH